MSHIFSKLAFASLVLTAVPALAQQPQWPPGEGREIVSVACVQCHAPTIIMTLREGPSGWRFRVHDMILRGAQVRNEEVDKVIEYLSSNFGPGMNLPKATPVSLPDGDGKNLVEQNCAVCHDLRRVTGDRFGRRDWDRVVAKMMSIGAPLTDAEGKTVTGYLQANFGLK